MRIVCERPVTYCSRERKKGTRCVAVKVGGEGESLVQETSILFFPLLSLVRSRASLIPLCEGLSSDPNREEGRKQHIAKECRSTRKLVQVRSSFPPCFRLVHAVDTVD